MVGVGRVCVCNGLGGNDAMLFCKTGAASL